MEIILMLIILLFSAILHEVAHGFVADKLGDPTARLLGRLTLNPKKHIDPIMSLFLPLILFISGSPVIFGGAKPVPVDPFNLKDGRKDLALVSLAGPLTNILLAIAAGLLIKLLLVVTIANGLQTTFLFGILYFILIKIAQINVLLAIFNFLPIPPLDGSKVFSLLLPEREAQNYLSLGRFGIFILLFLLMTPVGGFSLQSMISALSTFALKLLGIF